MLKPIVNALDSTLGWFKLKISSDGAEESNHGVSRSQPRTNPFFLIYLAYSFDEQCVLLELPRDVLGVILTHAWWAQPLQWQLTDSPHCQLKVTDDYHAAQCLVAGYRGQPFYSTGAFESFPCLPGGSALPLERGRYFFRYRIDQASTSTTMEIGVCNATIFKDVFTHQDVDCSNLAIRDNLQAFLYSWNGGSGRLFGNTSTGECHGGYMPQEEMIMELDLRDPYPERRQLLFYKAGPHWECNFSPFRQDYEKEKGRVKILARYWDLPRAVVPIAYLLGSGYDTKVSLIDVVVMH